MGYARWDHDDWSDYAAGQAGRRREEVFSRRSLDPEFDPLNIRLRESRDSAQNPESNAIIVAFDETGSMGGIPDAFVRAGLGTMVQALLDRRPVSDPHVMVMGFGDAWCDRAPLQVTQFEADLRIADQLARLYLEGGGGGNRYESYNLPWYFAARRTVIDCYEKRGKKGYLFTIGDEPPPPKLLATHVREFLGEDLRRDLDNAELLRAAGRLYEIFHVVVEQGSHYRSFPDEVATGWERLLGQRVLYLANYTQLAEVIVAAIEVNEGRDPDAVAASWADAAGTVARALRRLPAPARRRGLSGFFGRGAR